MGTPRQQVGSSIQDARSFNPNVNPKFAVDSGSTDAYAITLDPAPSNYYQGMEVYFIANTVNTGACTINVNGLGAKNLVRPTAVTPSNSDIAALGMVHAVYDGTNFQMLQFLPGA